MIDTRHQRHARLEKEGTLLSPRLSDRLGIHRTLPLFPANSLVPLHLAGKYDSKKICKSQIDNRPIKSRTRAALPAVAVSVHRH